MKKSRVFWVWLCFFIGINLLLSMAAVGLSHAGDIYDNFGDIMAIIRWDIKDMDMFKQDIALRYEHLLRVVKGTDYMENYVSSFSDEGDNLLYYAENLITGKSVGNVDRESVLNQDQFIMREGYDYYLYDNGSGITVYNRNKSVNVYGASGGYRNTWLNPYLTGDSARHSEVRIIMMVREDLVENPYAYSRLYDISYRARQARGVCFGVLAVIMLDLALLLYTLIRRREKREFDRTLARLSGRLWFEIKVVLSILALVFVSRIMSGPGFYTIGFTFIMGLWWFYIMLMDWVYNKKRFFTHNSINWLIGLYRRYEKKKPLQKALLRRIHALITAEMILVIFSFIFVMAGYENAFLAIPFVAAGLYLLYRYLRRFGKTVMDLGHMMDRIEAMRNGKHETGSSLAPDSDLYGVDESLARIQNGIQKAVDEKVRSERMKMELITNVSHDLKTPLTSIISYTDLIAREEGLPETVKDYIKVLSQKSDRLKTLIQDLFELSKAASGDMVLNMERIDLVRLVEQTLADMNEQVEGSGLTFRVNIPDTPVYVMSDGRRLYRVLQNLISNVLKYAMKSSRVYLSLSLGMDERVKVEIKNISNYEMNFESEEIMERFVRGDKARSTEGSGLGLAIARSFTHACGGSFNISVDGDLFKVTLGFVRDMGTDLTGDSIQKECEINKGTVNLSNSVENEPEDVMIMHQGDEKACEADLPCRHKEASEETEGAERKEDKEAFEDEEETPMSEYAEEPSLTGDEDDLLETGKDLSAEEEEGFLDTGKIPLAGDKPKNTEEPYVAEEEDE